MTLSLTELLRVYKEIETTTSVEHHLNRVTYDSPVNFNESLTTPRHRWYPYKEGFSPSFVRNFLQRNAPSKRLNVLDPFGGVGTTALEASLQGHTGLALEISPLATFIARTKATRLSTSELHEFAQLIKQFQDDRLYNVASLPNHQTVVSYFEEKYLEALLQVKSFYQNIEVESIRNLFKCAFLSSIETFSTHRKAGNGLKRKTHFNYRNLIGIDPLEQVKSIVKYYLEQFLVDLGDTFNPNNFNFIQESALTFNFETYGETFDVLLTSPPYANCFDYSKIYLCELWLGDFFTSKDDQRMFREHSVRSHVHARWSARYTETGSNIVNNFIYPLLSDQKMWSNQIPSMLRGYFMDVGYLLSRSRDYLEHNAPVGFVVGNSMYGGVPIATDLLISEMAKQFGYMTERIEVYRRVIPSSQQYLRTDDKQYLRESVVVMRTT